MFVQLFEILCTAVLVTGLVTVMMMLIECFNVSSKGGFAGKVSRSGPVQVILCALLGAVPGCMGGFAVVSMYTHGMVSFGALLAMMIASSGDESFVMLALIPRQALLIMAGLTVLAIVCGLVTDAFYKPARTRVCCADNFAVHETERFGGKRHFGWKRALMLSGVGLFLAALCFGFLEHEAEGPEAEYFLGGINLLSEDWMNVVFAFFGLLVIAVIIFANDHFVEEHLWHHIVREHLPKIFLWTLGTLAVIAVLMNYIDVSAWIGENTILMILLAALIGLIPESGPHLIFVTLFASGIVPLPVLVASCISQDGHAALPLLAEDRKSFLLTKTLNVLVALVSALILYFVF